MVLEQIYSASWIERKAIYAFLLGIAYSVIGIAFALFIFPEDPGLAAVALTTLILIPSVAKLLSIEEEQAALRDKFSFRYLWTDHRDIFKVYFFLFLGIFLSFAFFSIALPSMATSHLFEKQINMLGLASGDAVGEAAGEAGGYPFSFFSIFTNNLKVLIFCLLFSFVYGAGAIFLITWNASVWGVIFGVIAKNSTVVTGENAFLFFLLTLVAVFPHMFAEASAYFIGALSGGIISEAAVRERLLSPGFRQVVKDGLIVFLIAVIILIIAAYVEVIVPGKIINFFGIG